MRLSESASYPSASPQQVFELLSDEGFRGDVCARINALSYDVSVDRDGDATRVRIRRVMRADLPEIVKKITGETVEVEQTEWWEPAGGDGGRTGHIEVRIKNQPASMTGTTAILPTGDGAELSLQGEVQVAIPVLGKKAEPEIAKAVAAALRAEAAEGTARLGA